MNDPASFVFGPFRLDRRARVLWRGTQLEALTPRAFDLLAALCERPGEVLTKVELLGRVWPDTAVEEANLSVQVSILRKGLGPGPEGRPWIETVPRRGYRLAVAAGPRQGPPSLAVLPLRGLGLRPDDAYLGVALADALVTALGAGGELVVRPLRSTLALAADGLGAEVLGRTLGVDAVLDGSVQLAGGRLRVSLHLVALARGLGDWTGSFEAPFDGLFEAQDDVARQVARALGPSFQGPRPSAPDGAAYQAYLRGRYFWSRLSGPWIERACAEFGSAVALDPGFAPPHAGLAHAALILGFAGMLPPREAWRAASQSAAQALARDPGLPEALVARAFVRLLDTWDWDGAWRDLEAALEANPRASTTLLWRGLFLAMRGRLAEAEQELGRAEAGDPTSQLVSAARGFVACLLDDHQAELVQQQRTLELDPHQFLGHWSHGLALLHVGRIPEALAALAQARALAGETPLMLAVHAQALARGGDPGAARTVLQDLRARSGYKHPYQQAVVLAALGEDSAALAELARAVDERDPWVVWLGVDPMLEPLRTRDAFESLRRRVGACTAVQG